jgi:hypothetical protein
MTNLLLEMHRNVRGRYSDGLQVIKPRTVHVSFLQLNLVGIGILTKIRPSNHRHHRCVSRLVHAPRHQ